MGADWSKNAVVEGFMNRTLSTAAKTFTCSGTVKDVRDGEVEHPMQYVPITMAEDGKPVIAAQKMGLASWPNKLWKLLPKVSSTQGVPVANLEQEARQQRTGTRSGYGSTTNRGPHRDKHIK